MEHHRTYGYLVVVAGILLSFVSAVIPFFDDGYRLHPEVLFAGLMPYLAYAVLVELLRRPFTLLVGVVLLAAHAWLVVSERFLGVVDYAGGAIFVWPLLFTLVLTPLVVKAVHSPRQAPVGGE